MTVKIHIDRLVVDSGVLSQREAPLFRQALADELTYLQSPSPEPRAAANTAVSRLARQTAAEIHGRVPRS